MRIGKYSWWSKLVKLFTKDFEMKIEDLKLSSLGQKSLWQRIKEWFK